MRGTLLWVRRRRGCSLFLIDDRIESNGQWWRYARKWRRFAKRRHSDGRRYIEEPTRSIAASRVVDVAIVGSGHVRVAIGRRRYVIVDIHKRRHRHRRRHHFVQSLQSRETSLQFGDVAILERDGGVGFFHDGHSRRQFSLHLDHRLPRFAESPFQISDLRAIRFYLTLQGGDDVVALR